MFNALIRIYIITFFLTSMPSFAQQSPSYDRKLLRLAEILGSLHYIQNICSTPTNKWYNHMVALIEVENPVPQRRAYFYEAFNEAYRAFSENYHHCTQSAIEANKRYIKEGKSLSESLIIHPNN
ncbi:TIGR02301 family protein [Bartonella sp. B41]